MRIRRKNVSCAAMLYHSKHGRATARFDAQPAALAQLVERLIRNQQIVSSNLTGGSIKYKGLCEKFSHKPSSFTLILGSNRVAEKW